MCLGLRYVNSSAKYNGSEMPFFWADWSIAFYFIFFIIWKHSLWFNFFWRSDAPWSCCCKAFLTRCAKPLKIQCDSSLDYRVRQSVGAVSYFDHQVSGQNCKCYVGRVERSSFYVRALPEKCYPLFVCRLQFGYSPWDKDDWLTRETLLYRLKVGYL